MEHSQAIPTVPFPNSCTLESVSIVKELYYATVPWGGLLKPVTGTITIIIINELVLLKF